VNERFARHVYIPHWDQQRLGAASVIVVGVGGLGTEVAKLLAQAGVGRLVLCDPDTVETSNLGRGALFTEEQVGMFKVAAAAQALRKLAPEIVVDERADDFRYGIGLGELRSADLVLSCLDSVADRIALSSRCMFSDNPRGLLDAGLHPWGGEVRHYTPAGSCYVCGCSPIDRSMPAWHEACGLPDEMAASAPVVALVAAWQATCAVRLIFDEAIPEGIIKIDPLAGLSRPVLHRRDPDCPCHQVIDSRHIIKTQLTNESSVAELLRLAAEDERVQSWNPIDRRDSLSPLSLRAADPGRSLHDIGIPAAEILPVIRVRPVHHVRYLELQGA
jgi:adenylyltransferase/sulfurtransferase